MHTQRALDEMTGWLHEQFVGATATLHEWDHDWRAYEDREWGLFERQIANRVPVRNFRAKIVNPQPERVYAHIVIWQSGMPIYWTEPMTLNEGDWLEVDLSEVRLE